MEHWTDKFNISPPLEVHNCPECLGEKISTSVTASKSLEIKCHSCGTRSILVKMDPWNRPASICMP